MADALLSVIKGSRHIVTAKMLHDILLQKNVTSWKCYWKIMLLIQFVTEKNVADIMIQLQKVSYLFYLKYIQECYSPCRFPGVLLVENSPGWMSNTPQVSQHISLIS